MLPAQEDHLAASHSCADTRLYALVDVTVWVRVFKDGKLGGVRDSKRSITHEAHDTVASDNDVVCAGCGWMGRLS